jgi:hypothetical protein
MPVKRRLVIGSCAGMTENADGIEGGKLRSRRIVGRDDRPECQLTNQRRHSRQHTEKASRMSEAAGEARHHRGGRLSHPTAVTTRISARLFETATASEQTLS